MSMRERRRMLLATLGGEKVNLSIDNLPSEPPFQSPGIGYCKVEILENDVPIYSFQNGGYFTPVPISEIQIKKGSTITVKWEIFNTTTATKVRVYFNNTEIISGSTASTYSFVANGDVAIKFGSALPYARNLIYIFA